MKFGVEAEAEASLMRVEQSGVDQRGGGAGKGGFHVALRPADRSLGQMMRMVMRYDHVAGLGVEHGDNSHRQRKRAGAPQARSA